MLYIKLMLTTVLAMALGTQAKDAVYRPTPEEVARFVPTNLQSLFGLGLSKVTATTEKPAKKTVVKYYPVYIPVPPPTSAPTTEKPDYPHHHHSSDGHSGSLYPDYGHHHFVQPSQFYPSSLFGQFAPTTNLVPGYFPERFESPRRYGHYGRPYVPNPDYYIDINQYPIRPRPHSYSSYYGHRPSYSYNYDRGHGYDYGHSHGHTRRYYRRPSYDSHYEHSSKHQLQDTNPEPQSEEMKTEDEKNES